MKYHLIFLVDVIFEERKFVCFLYILPTISIKYSIFVLCVKFCDCDGLMMRTHIRVGRRSDENFLVAGFFNVIKIVFDVKSAKKRLDEYHIRNTPQLSYEFVTAVSQKCNRQVVVTNHSLHKTQNGVLENFEPSHIYIYIIAKPHFQSISNNNNHVSSIPSTGYPIER
jgi:hypothetical protein